MIQESAQLKSELYSDIISLPQNPCETCGFWSTMCNQSGCSFFQKYKEEMKRFNNCK